MVTWLRTEKKCWVLIILTSAPGWKIKFSHKNLSRSKVRDSNIFRVNQRSGTVRQAKEVFIDSPGMVEMGGSVVCGPTQIVIIPQTISIGHYLKRVMLNYAGNACATMQHLVHLII